jgi:hypothetical protein
VDEATGNTFVEQLSALVVVAAIAQKPHSPFATTTTEKNSKPKPKPDMYDSSKIQKPKKTPFATTDGKTNQIQDQTCMTAKSRNLKDPFPFTTTQQKLSKPKARHVW